MAESPATDAAVREDLQPQLRLLFIAGGAGGFLLILSLLTTFVWYSSPEMPSPPTLPSGPTLPTDLPTAIPTDLPGLPTDLPTDLPGFPTDLPTDLPGFPTDLPSLPQLPGGAP